MTKKNIVSPYPTREQMRIESQPGEAYDETKDPEFAQNMAAGGMVDPFEVGTHTGTVKTTSLPQPDWKASVGHTTPPSNPLPQTVTPQKTLPNPVIPPTMKLPGFPSEITPEEADKYFSGIKGELNKYGSDEQKALADRLTANRNSLPYKLQDIGNQVADGLMMSVARAGNPGWQQQFENQQNKLDDQQIENLRNMHASNVQNVQMNMKMDEMNPKSEASKLARSVLGPFAVQKLGIQPASIKNASSAELQSLLTSGMQYLDIQTQKELKEAMLGLQGLTAKANVANMESQQKTREEEIKSKNLEGLAKMPWYSRLMHPGIAKSYEEGAGLAEPEFEKTAINKQTGQRIGLRNGQWEPIQ